MALSPWAKRAVKIITTPVTDEQLRAAQRSVDDARDEYRSKSATSRTCTKWDRAQDKLDQLQELLKFQMAHAQQMAHPENLSIWEQTNLEQLHAAVLRHQARIATYTTNLPLTEQRP